MKTEDLTRYAHDPVAFTDRYIHVNELGQPFQLIDYQREIDRTVFVCDHEGRLPWDTFLDGRIKKTSKTFDNARRIVFWGFTQEPPNEIEIFANDQEQAISRVFHMVARLIEQNPELAASAEIQSRLILLSNGTRIAARASEYAGAAGGNQGCSSWDELWAYSSERLRRLWEEMTPVPTRRNSIRIATTYAGIEGESTLLKELYLQGVGPDEHPQGQGERIHPVLPIWLNREARLCCVWDHVPRMAWQSQGYYKAQRKALRPNTYARLHENRWVTAESVFLTAQVWDSCVDPELRPLLPTEEFDLFGGVDAGIKGDNAAVTWVGRDGDRLFLAAHRIWRPSPSEPLDLEGTIEQHLRDMHDRYRVRAILCDPYQLHRSITTLKAVGLPVEEFPQTSANTTRMGQTLFDLFNNRNIRLYPSDELRQHGLAAVAVENVRGWRLAKEKASRKIDAIVALSMACVAALDRPQGAPYRFLGGDIEPDLRSEDEIQRDAELAVEEAKRVSADEVQAAIQQTGVYWPSR